MYPMDAVFPEEGTAEFPPFPLFATMYAPLCYNNIHKFLCYFLLVYGNLDPSLYLASSFVPC